MSTLEQRIADNVARVRQAIAEAAGRSGRRAEDVTLIAVSKYVGVAEIDALLAAGCRDLGENRPQDLWHKAEQLRDRPIRWHMIGHLQRNKARRTLPLVTLLHAGDSWRLLEAASQHLQQSGQTLGRVDRSQRVRRRRQDTDLARRKSSRSCRRSPSCRSCGCAG